MMDTSYPQERDCAHYAVGSHRTPMVRNRGGGALFNPSHPATVSLLNISDQLERSDRQFLSNTL